MKKLFLTLISVAIIGQISAGDLVPADTFDYKPYLKAAALPLAGAVGTTILATSCLAAAVAFANRSIEHAPNFCRTFCNKGHLKIGAGISGQYGLATGAIAGTIWGLKRCMTNKRQGAGILSATFMSSSTLYFVIQLIQINATREMNVRFPQNSALHSYGAPLGNPQPIGEIVDGYTLLHRFLQTGDLELVLGIGNSNNPDDELSSESSEDQEDSSSRDPSDSNNGTDDY
jgi:hypothetical protein